jgi:quercetin dioxygenase-like cupin family protein
LGRGRAANDYQTAGTKGTDVVMQSITIDPGSATGWHTHPGLETAIIKSGTLTLFDSGNPSCAAQTFTAGQVFPGTEHPHLARNLGNVPIEIVSTYYNVPAGGPVASPAPEPANCAGK